MAVAYSGGRDSTALLHATLAAAAEQGIRVAALHVHHGLSENADAWLAHCEERCARWRAHGLPLVFDHRRLAGAAARGESVEAWARRARYAALREMAVAHDASLVLLAHHRQDQAETFLLQALRGAGVSGLAAMPRIVEREGLTWARPWLACPSASVAAYARHFHLRHVEDDTNADRRFARNRLRRDIWPALSTAFAQADAALAASAVWAGEARSCAADLAAIDLARLTDEHGLDLAAWAALTRARRSNVLRAWLVAQTGAAPSAVIVQRLLAELGASAPARWSVGKHSLQRYRGRLTCTDAATPVPAARTTTTLCLLRGGTYALPDWGGRLRVRSVACAGVARSCLTELRLVARRGGEQFQAGPARPARSLKKQFQARAVPGWARRGPLLYAGDQLVYVPGLGIDARALAPKGVRQVSFEWLPDAD